MEIGADMTILSDVEIENYARKGMIDPFVGKQINKVWRTDCWNPVISFGLSSYGYDLRLAPEFKIFTNLHAGVIDPKKFDPIFLADVKGDICVIPPNSFALSRSIEYIKMPRDLVAIVVGKSTYARCGVIVNVTAFEPEWTGNVTIEISNTAPLPVKIYANEGICQVIFLKADHDCKTSYGDRNGKYQGQQGITLAK
jgi:dCTP deaminase